MPVVFYGQQINSDSLWKQLAEFKGTDKETQLRKKQKLSDVFGVVMYSDIPTALRITDSLAETCRLLGDSAAYYEALYRHKASVYYTIHDYVNIFKNLRSYADAVMRTGENNGYAFIDIGNQYFGMSLTDIAVKYYRKANEVFIKTNNHAGSCTVYDNMGLIWREKKNIDSCLFYYEKSLVLRRDSIKDRFLVAYTHLKTGNALGFFSRNKESLTYYFRGFAIMNDTSFRKYKDFVSLREPWVTTETAMARYHFENSNNDSAWYYILNAERHAAEFNLQGLKAVVYRIKAGLLIADQKYPEAFELIQKSEKIVRERNDGYGLVDVLKEYANYYEATGDWKKANAIHRNYLHVYDSLSAILNDDQMLVVNNALLQFENESRIEKQNKDLLIKENQVAESKREKQNLLLLLAGLLLVVLLIGYLLTLFRRKNKLIEKYNTELEVANNTKEKFLSIISHDLRNPFNSLIGISNLLIGNLKENNFSEAASNAESIHESSRKAYVMLDNLMQWVSVQKENIQVRKENTPLVPLVDEMLQLFRSQAMAQSVTISKDIRVEAILTDRYLLQVILRNLLSNAIRHIPVGGKVSITVVAAEKNIHITVEDNGKGLDEETLKMIFGRKEKMAVARKGGGLGLELVQEFVEQLGGEFNAGNVSGGGAGFTVVLFDAASGASGVSEETSSKSKLPELSAEEKSVLHKLAKDISRYEIFDTTELRNLLGQTESTWTPAMLDWQKKVIQAVYHGNQKQFDDLLQMILHTDGHI